MQAMDSALPSGTLPRYHRLVKMLAEMGHQVPEVEDGDVFFDAPEHQPLVGEAS